MIMGFLDDIFDGETVMGGLFDLDSDGKVSIEEALLADELFLKDDPPSASPLEDDEDLLDSDAADFASTLGLDPLDYDSMEDLEAAIRSALEP